MNGGNGDDEGNRLTMSEQSISNARPKADGDCAWGELI